jgi:hypothetical protein
MNTPLLLAAAGLALIGLVHSVLGEVLVFRKLRTHGLVPTAGYPVLRERHVRILWASWHLVTVLGWALGALLWRMGGGSWGNDLATWVDNTTTLALLVCALLVGFATKGRHPAWCALLVVAVLVGWR